MRGHRASMTRVNALVTRASISESSSQDMKMDCQVKPGNDAADSSTAETLGIRSTKNSDATARIAC
jgi:hypothetical protein